MTNAQDRQAKFEELARKLFEVYGSKNPETTKSAEFEDLARKILTLAGVSVERQDEVLRQERQHQFLIDLKMANKQSPYLPFIKEFPETLLVKDSSRYRFVTFFIALEGETGVCVGFNEKTYSTVQKAEEALMEQFMKVPDKSVVYADIKLIRI